MLKIIEIEYIKGIQQKRFELDILPNKPSILVAPNGFGKSSFAAAFNSLNNRRIDLKEDDYYQENSDHQPIIYIEYVKQDGSLEQLRATNNSNSISRKIDCFVINNPTKPRGIGSQFGRATATLEIKDVVLVDRIPQNISFGYSFKGMQNQFGKNSRILPNINGLLSNRAFIEKLSEGSQELERANGARIQTNINAIITDINAQQGTVDDLNNWVLNNRMDQLRQINYLNTIGDLVNKFDVGYGSEVKSYLSAIQLIWLYNQNPNIFHNACVFSNYQLEKERFAITLTSFNSTWKNIGCRETNGELVVKFPKAIHISNGQRDILTFISMLFKARRNLKKDENILIIDEVFDYLDDANLTAAQFYITQFIKEYTELGKRIYPLILTHLNPYYFKNFAFSNQKVYYLDKSNCQLPCF